MQAILDLPELRKHLLNFLIFDFNEKQQKNSVNKSEVKTWRLVSKACLQTVHQCLNQEIRNTARNRDYQERQLSLFTLTISETTEKSGRTAKDLLTLLNSSTRVQPEIILPFGIYLNVGVCSDKISKEFVDILTKCNSGLVEIHINFQQSAATGIVLPAVLKLTNLRFLSVHYSVTRKISKQMTLVNSYSGAQMVQALLNAASSTLQVFKILPSMSSCSVELLHFPDTVSSIHMNGRMGMQEMANVLLGGKTNLRNLKDLSLTTNKFMDEPMERGQVFKILLLCRKTLEILELNGLGSNNLFQIPPVMDKLKVLNVGSSWTLEEKACRSNLPELKRLDLKRNSEKEVNTWTTRYPADSLDSLKVRLRGEVETEIFRDVSLTRTQIELFHYAYPNITHLDIQLCPGPSNESILEHIFEEMLNLVQLHVFVQAGLNLNWDGALIGASADVVKNLRRQNLDWDDLTNVDLQTDCPSIRDLKYLRNLKIHGGYLPTGYLCQMAVIAENYFLSDLSIRFGFLKMEKLEFINITNIPTQISARDKEEMKLRFGKNITLVENSY